MKKPYKAKPTRDSENDTRKKRLAKVKRGPGVFVYDGSAFDTEAIPTILTVGKNVPLLDSQGYPILDATGRQMYERAGRPVYDMKGQPMLGGPPKIVKHKIDAYKLWGMEFPEGQAVFVEEDALALKLRLLSCFEELPEMPVAEAAPDNGAEGDAVAAPKKRGRPAKVAEA